MPFVVEMISGIVRLSGRPEIPVLPILLVLADPEVHPELPHQWAQFSRYVDLRHTRETVDIATDPRQRGKEFRYRLRYTKRPRGKEPEIKWADSATCPSVRSVIANMRDIKMPSPAPYGVPDQSTTIILHGAIYSLTAPSSDNMGKLTISSNVGSSLASWVNASLKQLDPCWTATAS